MRSSRRLSMSCSSDNCTGVCVCEQNQKVRTAIIMRRRLAAGQRKRLRVGYPNLQQCGVFVPAQYPAGTARGARSVAEATCTLTFWTSSADPERIVQCVHVHVMYMSVYICTKLFRRNNSDQTCLTQTNINELKRQVKVDLRSALHLPLQPLPLLPRQPCTKLRKLRSKLCMCVFMSSRENLAILDAQLRA